ncbi:prolyl oligopeptidase family serine peptidase [Flavivirga abyssicola]|uniref:carboxylesterase family protein n=1 Tax=Flavivirga abyssicola TaxID=3063533 RepID=UPI0026E0735A|nr:prolyl oligopeptidase family serine peptidase [Flavivirga sp. MEBiC07777]WVK13161.1 prolyl oligopeptidase family serine peptidase [Flavivirga sp. MEBiC07777]
MLKLPIPFIFFVFLSCISAKAQKVTLKEKAYNMEELTIDSLLTKYVFSSSNGLKMPYRLFSPKNEAKTKIPLVVFLHGRGDRGVDNDSKIYHEAGIITNSNSLLETTMQSQYPCHILIPQCSDKTENEEWAKWIGNSPETPFKGLGTDGTYKMSPEPSESGAAALELIEQTIKDKNIDTDRVYIIGLSMGGFGTWEFTARKPHLFAGAIPMAGYSDPDQLEKIKHISFWIFHGDIDKWNPVTGSRTMFKLLSNSNADVKYTEYRNTGHGESFKKAFNETELIPWLFSKKRKMNSSQKKL